VPADEPRLLRKSCSPHEPGEDEREDEKYDERVTLHWGFPSGS